jgi:hypothetical protein
MDCETEDCPKCHLQKKMGDTKVLACLHTVCGTCYIIKACDECPLCKTQVLRNKQHDKQLNRNKAN